MLMLPKEEWKVISDHHEALVTPEVYDQVSVFHPNSSTKRKREKHPLTGKLYCGGCGYAMVYKPLQGKNKNRRFECWKHAMLQIPECCTNINAGVLEELVLTMIGKELMIRGEAASQEKSLYILHKNQLAVIKNKIADLRRTQERIQVSKDKAYEEYVAGRITSEEYQKRVAKLEQQTERLSGQMNEHQEKFFVLEEELERIEADMKLIIRYSHMEELTQELVDTFIERIYVYKDKRVEIKWKFREG